MGGGQIFVLFVVAILSLLDYLLVKREKEWSYDV